MFEGLAESLLKSILGEYVENLDSQHLSISVWSGHVSLRDLRLKRDLCAKFNLPFDLKLGIIKHLVLEVPWARLASSPVVCKLDQLFLIISPQKERDWKMQDITTFEAKAATLREHLQRHLAEATMALAQQLAQEAERAQAAGGKSSKQNQQQAQQQAGYFERYVTRIKDNLQVGISNIHVRLEDQQEKLIEEYTMNDTTAGKQEASSSGIGLQRHRGRKSVLEKLCIGITLQELNLRTRDYNASAPELSREAGDEDIMALESLESSSDSEQQESQGNLEANSPETPAEGQLERDGANNQPTSASASELTAGETKAATLSKKAASQASAAFFFDRTGKEHRGVPLLREFSIKGFAIYIDSGPNTRLISFPSGTASIQNQTEGAHGVERIETAAGERLDGQGPSPDSKPVENLTPEQLDEAMQELHKKVFEQAADPAAATSQGRAKTGDPASSIDDESAPEAAPACANFVIKPQSVHGRMVQQPSDLGLTRPQQAVASQEKRKAGKEPTSEATSEAASSMLGNQTEHPKRIEKAKPVPQLSLDVHVHRLTVRIQKHQYECIFRMAEYVRQYNLKHDHFNRHRKYKYMRPIFPLTFGLGQLRAEVQEFGAPADSLVPDNGLDSELAAIGGSSLSAISDGSRPLDLMPGAEEVKDREEQLGADEESADESAQIGQVDATKSAKVRPVALDEVGLELVLARLTRKLHGDTAAFGRVSEAADPRTRPQKGVLDSSQEDYWRSSVASQDYAAEESFVDQSLASSQHMAGTPSSTLTAAISGHVSTEPGIDREFTSRADAIQFIRRNQTDCTKRKNRTLLHSIPTENVNAKAWWQYAISCVIKDNRQTRTGNGNEFYVESTTRKQQYQALQLLIGKLIDEGEFKEEQTQKNPALQDKAKKKGREGAAVTSKRAGKGVSGQKTKEQKARGKGAQPASSFSLDLAPPQTTEKCLLVHCVEAVPLKDLKVWTRTIVYQKVQADQRTRQTELQNQQLAAASQEEAKTSESDLKRLGSASEKVTAIQSAVKQGYGSQILSYISFWGGSTNQSAQNAADQQKAAEAAVEAVTLAEASKDPGLMDEIEPAVSIAEQSSEGRGGPTAGDGGELLIDAEAYDVNGDQEQPIAKPDSPINSVLTEREQGNVESLAPAASMGENRFRFQLRCKLDDARVIIENICPQQSLELYFQTVKADFRTKDQAHRLRVRNSECGINHVALPDNRFARPTVKRLIAIKRPEAPGADESTGRKAQRHAWKFDLAIRSTKKEELEPTAAHDQAGESPNEQAMRQPLGQEDPNAHLDDEFKGFEPHIGSGSGGERMQYESKFDTGEITVQYQADVVQNLCKFFQLDQADELRAQALDRIAQLSEQSQMSLRELIQQQRVSKIDFNLGKITVVIPFRAHNSSYVGEQEHLRDRAWQLSVAGTNLQSVDGNAADDIYEKFKVTLRAVGLKFGKRDYPNLLNVMEDLDIALLIRLKSKLKSLLQKDQQTKSKVEANEAENREEQQREQEPEVLVTSLDGHSLPDLRLNLTPDSFNALVNIYGVLAPENTKAEVTRQFKEKQNIIQASSFKKVLPALGVRETRLTSNWHNYFVVLSGSYIYFYKEEQDLMPYHYLYILSTNAYSQNQHLGLRWQHGDGIGGDDAKVQDQGSTGNGFASQEQRKMQGSMKDKKSSQEASKYFLGTILVLRGRNGEQISLNFGRTRLQRNNGQIKEGSSTQVAPDRVSTNQNHNAEATVADSVTSRRSRASAGSSRRSHSGSKHSKSGRRHKDNQHRVPDPRDAESIRALFQNLIYSRQQEFRGNEDLTNGALNTRKEAVSSRITQGNLSPEQYYQQSSLKLDLSSQNVHIRLFKDDYAIMNDKIPNYEQNAAQNPGGVWSFMSASNIVMHVTTQPFDNHVQLEMGKACIKEASRLHRDILVLDEPSSLNVTLWSINSPTIKDSEMEVQACFGGRPILVYDPIFVNELIKYFRNTADQASASAHKILKELHEQEKLKRARQQALLRREQAFGQGRLFGLHDGQENDGAGGHTNVLDQYKTPQFSGEGQHDDALLDGKLRLPKEKSNQDERGSSSDVDQANFDKDSQKHGADFGTDDAGSSSEDSEEKESWTQTCQSVKLIMMKTELRARGGLTLVCLHHKFTTGPYMELNVENLTLKHHMMYDHDILEGEFESAVLNDLTMWPRTQNPHAFREQAEATRKRMEAGEHLLEAKNLQSTGHALPLAQPTLAEYVNSLQRQVMIGIKDPSKPSGMTLRTTMIYDGCPLKNADWSLQCIAKVTNMRLHYYQEQLMRVISYFTNRFLWALTASDPYAEFQPPPTKSEMSIKEINDIKDLLQPDFDTDLQVEVVNSSVLVKERPYLDQRTLELEIERIKISVQEEAVMGRHTNLPKLSMKLSRMNFDIESAQMLFTDREKSQTQQQVVSNTFNIDFTLVYPNYSAILEQISSNLLDKSSEIIVKLHPTIQLRLSQELYTFMMRCNALNLSYCDDYREEFDFSQVNEIFQSKDNLLYMSTKIEIENEFLLILEQEGQELVKIKLRNAERSSTPACPTGKQPSPSRDFLRIEQFLDGQLKMQVQMGIPTLLHPSDLELESRVGSLACAPRAEQVQHLLVGTESDPHMVYAEQQEPIRIKDLRAEGEKTAFTELSGPKEATKHGKPGKFLFKMHWTADGQQQMDCKIDKVKVFVRPNCFMKVGHFFGYGYPEFNQMSEDRPNHYEADLEKLPVMKLKVELLDSMICMDSFEPADLASYLRSPASAEQDAQNPGEGGLAGSFRSVAPSMYAHQPQADSRRGTTSRRHTAMPSAGGGPTIPEDPLKSNKDAQEGTGPSTFTTIVCSAQRIEYVYSREQISSIKEDLYQDLKEFVKAKQQKQNPKRVEVEGKGQQLGQIDSSAPRPGAPGQPDLAASQYLDPSKPRERGGKAPEQIKEATEVNRQSYMRMLLKVRQFSPYICDSIDLDSFGFDDIQKRQLISPMDVTFSHSKLLKVEHSGVGEPGRFTPFQKNEIEVGKAMLKVTFSDVLVLQETSTKLLESQQRYEDFLVEYLGKYKKNEIIKEQQNQRVGEKKDRRGSFLSFGHASRAGRARGSFQSCPRAESGDYGSQHEMDEQELIKNEANQVASQMRSNLVTYMTGFSSQKAAAQPYQSHGSASLVSRQNSASDFFDARSRADSRSSVSGNSQNSRQSRMSRRNPRLLRQGSGAAFPPARLGQSQNFVDSHAIQGPQRAQSRLEGGTSGLLLGPFDRQKSWVGSSTTTVNLQAAVGAQHLQERHVAVIQEEEQINETDREGEEDLVRAAQGHHAQYPAQVQGHKQLNPVLQKLGQDTAVTEASHADLMFNQDSDQDQQRQFYSITSMHHIKGISHPDSRAIEEQLDQVEEPGQNVDHRSATIVDFVNVALKDGGADHPLIGTSIAAAAIAEGSTSTMTGTAQDQIVQGDRNESVNTLGPVSGPNVISLRSDALHQAPIRPQSNDESDRYGAARPEAARMKQKKSEGTRIRDAHSYGQHQDHQETRPGHSEIFAATDGAQEPYPAEETDSDEEDLIIWEVDYGHDESYSGVQFRTAVHLAGVHMMIINDHENIFYPILAMNMDGCSLTLENRLVGLRGDTDIKMMISYYNNSLDVWEPFLERTQLRLSIEQDMLQSQLYACFRRPVNLNFSEELIENVLHAYMSLEKTKKEEQIQASNQQHQIIMNQQRRHTLQHQMGGQPPRASEHMMKQQVHNQGPMTVPSGWPPSSSRTSEAPGLAQSQRFPAGFGGSQPLQALALSQAKQKPMEIVHRKNLEFKVTPYRIVNMTSKALVIKRHNINNVLSSRHARAHGDGQGPVAPGGGSHSSNRYGHQSRQGPQGSSSKGKSSRFQNQLTKHPILQQSHQRLENARGEAAVAGHQGVLPRQGTPGRHSTASTYLNQRSQVPNKYYMDSGGSIDYEVDYEDEAKHLIMTSRDDLVRKQDFIDIIFDEGKSEKDKIRAYNLANQDLHQHPFSSEQFDFIIFGMSMSKSKVRKTFTLRNPFIIFNKTESTYMLKIIKYQSSEEKILQIAPGEGYPLSHQELRCKIMFSTYQDYFDAQELSAHANPKLYSQKQEEIWSSHFKVSNFFLKHDISKKKFFVYHAQKFSMIFVQPGQFFAAWDICIKVPLIIRNVLPFNLRIRTYHVRKYIQPRSMLLSSQKKKEIIQEKVPSEYVIQKQGKQFFHNFNLEGEVRFELNLDINNDQSSDPDDPLMRWYQFVLVRDEYKSNDKMITLVDRTTGQTLDLCAKIKSTEQTDLEITFYCQNCVVNNTDQNIVLWSQEGKKRLACQNTKENSVIMLSDKTTKVLASIQQPLPAQSHVSSKNMSQAFSVNVVGISGQISIMKDKDRHHEFILNTTWSLVSPTETIYSKITTINPQYVVCNQTNRLLLVAQCGFQDRQVEVIPHQGRLPLYWTDPKAQQRLQFKLAEADRYGAFDETAYEWSKKIKPQKIGRISIRCRTRRNIEECEHVVVIKQVNKETQTVYLIFQIENEASPTYRIENRTESIWMEYFQQGIVPSNDCCRETLPPGESRIYSWIDPEQTKTKKVLCCHLNLFNRREGELRSMQKLEIEFDNLEYQQTFRGRFVDDDFQDFSASDGRGRKQTHQLIKKAVHTPDAAANGDIGEVSERIIKIETVTDGCTKTLCLTERRADDKQLTSAADTEDLKDYAEQPKEALIDEMLAGRKQKELSGRGPSTKSKSTKKKGKPESKLESIDDPNVLYEVEEKPERESKVQLDIGRVYISFIAKGAAALSEKRIRREFLLGYLESIEFLMVDADDAKDIQLRVGYFQLDNNSNSEGRQLFPQVLYPKEVQNRYNNLLDQPSSQAKRRQRKDFFNAHVRMKQSQSDLVYIHKMEFLLQSAVLQMDDELIGWLLRLADSLAAGLGANLVDVHQVFEREEGRFVPNRQEPQSAGIMERYATVDQQILQQRDLGNQGAQGSRQRAIQGQPAPVIATSHAFSAPATGFAKPVTNDHDHNDAAGRQTGAFQAPETPDWSNLRSSHRADLPAPYHRQPERRFGIWFNFAAFSDDAENVPLFAQMSSNSWSNYDIDARANPVFIEELVMSPIDIEITFRTRVKSENELIGGLQGNDDTSAVMRRLKQLGLSLTNVDKAAFRLNSLVIANVYGTPEEINTVLYAHYRHRLMKNVLGLFLSSAALGNLNLLVLDIGTGVKDFFYRPAEGFVDGPIEGGKGLVIGTASLLGNTAKGAFGSVSRIMNTVSKSLLFLAGDEDFIDQREQDALDKPENVLQGVAQGLKSTFAGVRSGVAGIYQQPAKGAKAGGVKGFMKGAALGLGGAVVKPVSGGLDLLMKTSEGVHNMVKVGGRGKQKAAKKAAQASVDGGQQAEEDAIAGVQQTAQAPGQKISASATGNKHHDEDAESVAKIRAFRPFYGRDQRLKAFHELQAYVALDLKVICQAEYAKDHFLDAMVCELADPDEYFDRVCIILTEERLLVVDAQKSKIADLPVDRLWAAESRSVYAKRDRGREEEKHAAQSLEQPKSSRTPTGYDLVVRVFEDDDAIFEFTFPAEQPREPDQIDSSTSTRMKRGEQLGPSRGDPAAGQQQLSGGHRVMVNTAHGPRAVVDGFVLHITDKTKVKDFRARLENFICYVRSPGRDLGHEF